MFGGFFQRQFRISFGNSAVKALFGTSLLMMIATYLSTVSSMLIVGQIVGEVGLAAVDLVTPLNSYATFIAGMIGIGSALLYFRYLGASELDRANEIFGQAIILALAVGLLLYIAMSVGKNAFFDSMQLSEAVRSEAEAFWKYQKLLVAIIPIDFLLFELLYTDTLITVIANVVLFTVGIGSSIIFTKLYGTMGASMGMAVGYLLCDLVLCLHFFRKKNIFSFTWHFSGKDILEMFRLSLVDSSSYLDSGILVLFINTYVIRHFTESMLPVSAVIIAVLDMVVVFDSIGAAFSPVAEVYLGEGNYQDEKDVARFSLILSVLFGLVVAVFFILFAPLLAKSMGLTDPDSIEKAVKGVRLFALSLPFFSISYMMISQYVAVREIAVAVAYEWSKSLILPAAFIFIFGKLFGFQGIWAAFIPGEILTILIFSLGVLLFSKKEKSIWLLEDNRYPTHSRSYYVSEQTAVEARDDVEHFLLKNGISAKIITEVMMTVEEMTMLLLGNNHSKKVIVQYTVVVENDCICLYERDNGVENDLSASNEDVTDFRRYVYDCLINVYDYSQFLSVIDYNRNVFRYSLDPDR